MTEAKTEHEQRQGETLRQTGRNKKIFSDNRVPQLCLTVSRGESFRHGRAVGTNDSSVSVINHLHPVYVR